MRESSTLVDCAKRLIVLSKQSKPWIFRFKRLWTFVADRGFAVAVVYVFALALGLLAVGFALLADAATDWQKNFYFDNPNLALLLPPVALPLALWLVNTLFHGAGGSGIPQAVKVIRSPTPKLVQKLIGLRSLIGKFLLTPLVIASGCAVGREGPTIQIGAALMVYAQRFPRVTRFFDTQTLIITGAAAGVAAAFNTPLGGVMFAFEELAHRKVLKQPSILLMAVVLAGLVALMLQGNYAYFGYSNATIDWRENWLTLLTLAVCTGALGGVYGRILVYLTSKRSAVGVVKSKHPYAFAFFCGVGISTLAFVFGHQVFGAGYEETKLALQESEGLAPEYWLVKLSSVILAFASGAPGGVFAPTLSIGAGFGHFFAGLQDQEVAPFMILGMVGVLAGLTHAPITAFVIVLEMVDNHGFIMPMILTAAVSTQISRRIMPTSVYRLLANNLRVPPSVANTPDTQRKAEKE